MRGIVPPHLKARFEILDTLAPAAAMPAPWGQIAIVAVGGLSDVGFADSTDLLLIVSDSGRSVVDGRDGSRLARDDEDETVDVGNLLAGGIGPLRDRQVRVSGLRGGGLPVVTSDGWGLEHHPLSWPDDELFLSPPGQSMLWQPPHEPLQLTKLAGFSAELRAYGFSPTGRTFIIATAADVLIVGRP